MFEYFHNEESSLVILSMIKENVKMWIALTNSHAQPWFSVKQFTDGDH